MYNVPMIARIGSDLSQWRQDKIDEQMPGKKGNDPSFPKEE